MKPEVWINIIDGARLVVQPDGTGTVRSRHGSQGHASVENMELVRSGQFWRREDPAYAERQQMLADIDAADEDD